MTLNTFEVVDLTTNNTYSLEPNIPLIIGRGEKFGIQDRTVSRKQGEVSSTDILLMHSPFSSQHVVQLEALPDGRCFAERVSSYQLT
jgi:hypothetical protein